VSILKTFLDECKICRNLFDIYRLILKNEKEKYGRNNFDNFVLFKSTIYASTSDDDDTCSLYLEETQTHQTCSVYNYIYKLSN
jgi:hypothetical protein